MVRIRLLTIIFLTILLISLSAHPVLANKGLPNSATFGYGARLDMWGSDVYAALELASAMGLDWLAVDVDWARHWPSIDRVDFSMLDYILQAARQKQISVLLSLTNAPDWALTATGPEPNYTNALLQSILNVYSDVIQAVELFPGLNSTSRWGTVPNPGAYLTMLQTVRKGCDNAGRSLYLITTVEPILPGTSDGSLDEKTFLEQLYTLGAAPFLPIVGIRYSTIMGAPMSDESGLYPITLRHYEGIRTLMLKHQHARGMLWITGFAWPTSGTQNPAEPLTLPKTPAHQAQWVNHAFQLLRAQLYIGTAFFASLNHENASHTLPALYQTGGSVHPACVTISQFAGGNLTTTAWTASQNIPASLPASPTATPVTYNFVHSEGKPRK